MRASSQAAFTQVVSVSEAAGLSDSSREVTSRPSPGISSKPHACVAEGANGPGGAEALVVDILKLVFF